MSGTIVLSAIAGVVVGVLCGVIVAFSDLSAESPILIGAGIGLVSAAVAVALIRIKRKG